MNERDLFIATLQIDDPAERAAYLDKGCGGDAELRQRVEALLAAFGQAGSFLQQPAAAPSATAEGTPVGPSQQNAPAEELGTVIGPYKLLQQIGEGGMGTVFMAEQNRAGPAQGRPQDHQAGHGHAAGDRPLRGRAAGPGPDGPPQHRQGARRRHHRSRPALLRHGAGQGHAHHRVLRRAPLDAAQRLELFVPVCQAVQHAHQKGIIHRDLKPSNVLVALYDGKPVPKVIDFGVAKATGRQADRADAVHRLRRRWSGTLEYMSPEQAGLNSLDVDTRSDIYSPGRAAVRAADRHARPWTRKRLTAAALDWRCCGMIREEEPPRPSTRLSTTDELPSVAANRRAGAEAAERAGARRAGLDRDEVPGEGPQPPLRDGQRPGAGHPALPGRRAGAGVPAVAGYRLRKFVRRNKGPVVAAALVAAGSWSAASSARLLVCCKPNGRRSMPNAKRSRRARSATRRTRRERPRRQPARPKRCSGNWWRSGARNCGETFILPK